MTAEEVKARARQAITEHVRQAVAESDQRLLASVLAGEVDPDVAAATWAEIHCDVDRTLAEAFRTSDAKIEEFMSAAEERPQ